MSRNEIAAPTPTADLDRVKHDIDTFGYGVLLNVLTPDQICRLRDRLIEQAALECEEGVAFYSGHSRGGGTFFGKPEGDPPWQGVRTLLNKGRPFIDHMMNAKILEVIRHVMRDKNFYLVGGVGLIQREGTQQMAVHSDQQQQIPGGTTSFPYICNVMTALSEFTAEAGATQFVPGSHRMQPAPVEFDRVTGTYINPQRIGLCVAECPAGSSILFEGRTWHANGSTHSSEPRYSLSTIYGLTFYRQQDCVPASLHDDVYASMTDEERAMAGFRHAPFGRLDPRFPGDRGNVDVRAPYVPELRRGSGKHASAVPGASSRGY